MRCLQALDTKFQEMLRNLRSVNQTNVFGIFRTAQRSSVYLHLSRLICSSPSHLVHLDSPPAPAPARISLSWSVTHGPPPCPRPLVGAPSPAPSADLQSRPHPPLHSLAPGGYEDAVLAQLLWPPETQESMRLGASKQPLQGSLSSPES